jgi:DNA-binding transcriptional MerR regulator
MSNHRLLVSVPEAAKMLGISTRTLHRYCALQLLPHTRIGRRKLLLVSQLVKFAETGVSVERLRRVKAQLATRS